MIVAARRDGSAHRARWRKRSSDRCTSPSWTSRERRSPTWVPPTSSSARTRSPARSCTSSRPANPMQIALLVDNSEAAEPYIRDYREAIPAFVAAMTDPSGPRHQISLIALAERPTIFTEYTNDRRAPAKRRRPALLDDGKRHLSARRHHRNQSGHQQARLAAPGDRRHHDGGARVERPAVISRSSSR